MSDHRKLGNSQFRDLLSDIFETTKDNPADFNFTTELISEIKSRRDGIGEKIATQIAAKAASKAATTSLGQQRKSDNDFVSDLKIKMRAGNVPAERFVQVGFDVDDATPTPNTPQTPLDLSVKGFSNGTNTLKFNRNGNKQNTVFIIEARIGDATDYAIVGTSTKTTYEHKDQKPGVKVVYRVRAQRGDEISDPSNEAVVYDE